MFRLTISNYLDIKTEFVSCTVIEGPNRSGKSSIVHALQYFVRAIKNSYRKWPPLDEFNPYDVLEDFYIPLGDLTKNGPVSFEMSRADHTYYFRMEGTAIVEEWLEYQGNEVFHRSKQEVKGWTGPAIVKKILRPNALFLSTAAQFNGKSELKAYSALTDFNFVQGSVDSETYPKLDFNDYQGLMSTFKIPVYKCAWDDKWEIRPRCSAYQLPSIAVQRTMAIAAAFSDKTRTAVVDGFDIGLDPDTQRRLLALSPRYFITVLKSYADRGVTEYRYPTQ